MTRSAPTIAFVSPHCLVDFTNGAATATRDGLKLLASQGFQCMAFCGTRLDEAGEGLIQEQLFRRKINYEVRKVWICGQGAGGKAGLKNANCKLQIENSGAINPHPETRPHPSTGEGTRASPHPNPLPSCRVQQAGEGTSGYDARMIFLREGGIAVTLFENGSTRGAWFGPQEVMAFLAGCDMFLRKNRPDVVVTYGGDPVSLAVQQLVKRLGAAASGVAPSGAKGTVPFLPVQKSGQSPMPAQKSGQSPVLVFWLHNFAYSDRRAFEAVDRVIVPSEFSRQHYRQRLGLDCHVLPNVVNWAEAEVEVGMGRGREREMGRQGDGEMGGQSEAAVEVVSPRPYPGEGQGVRAVDGKARSRLDTNTIGPHPNHPLPSTGEGTGGRNPNPLPSTGEGTRGYVTFINPHVDKGVYVFARIARELAARRPDIPLLVTQGRSRADALKAPELGLGPHLAGELAAGGKGDSPIFADTKIGTVPDARNIFTMPFTPDPRDFYPAVFARTKMLLMPSLWLESFGLVAAEAMLNGIPVLASNRGALPETLGGTQYCPHPNPLPVGERTLGPHPNPLPSTGEGTGGFIFDIPGRYTPESRDVPTADEVAPWLETISRLWDDAAEYKRVSRAARRHAEQWRPERLAPFYRDFFSRLANRKAASGAS